MHYIPAKKDRMCQNIDHKNVNSFLKNRLYHSHANKQPKKVALGFGLEDADMFIEIESQDKHASTEKTYKQQTRPTNNKVGCCGKAAKRGLVIMKSSPFALAELRRAEQWSLLIFVS